MASDVSPWKLGGLSLSELGRRVWSEFWADEVVDRAAALAYYFLFALFPLLLFLTSLLGVLPIPHLMDRFMAYVAQTLPPDAASMLQKTLGEILAGASGGLLSVGVLGALWAGSSGMASAMAALNVAYDVDDVRPFWKRRGVAVLLTVGFTLFTLTALALLVFGPKLGETVAGWVGLGRVFTVVWNVVSIPVVVLLVMIGVALVYYFAPSTEQHWRWVTPGSAVAIVLWLALSFGLRFYVTNFASYNTTYGSIGGVILLVLWLYLSSLALLLGAEVNSEIEHAAARRGAADAKEAGTRTTGALAHQQPGRLHAVPGRGRVQSVTDGLGRLARLEVELALAETRSTARSGAVAIGVAVVAAVSALTGLVVLLAAALAPAFQADWRPLVVAGGGGALLGAAGLAWAAYRLRNLDLWRATVASLKENREWAERRLRYATRSPSRAAS